MNSINLLPAKEKNYLLNLKIFKGVFVFGVYGLFFILITAMLFLSIKYHLLYLIINQNNFFEKELLEKDNQKIEKQINDYNNKIDKILSLYKEKSSMGYFLNDFLSINIPEEIIFNYISFSLSEKDFININVSGISRDRDSIVLLRDNIDNNKMIKDVYFSPESWIKSKDVVFNIKFQYENKK